MRERGGMPGARAAGTPRLLRAKGVRKVPLTVALPSGKPLAGIVVIQDAFGVTDALRAGLRRLADAGFLAVAPHLYHRVAKEPFSDFAAAEPRMRALTGADMDYDISDAAGYLDAAGLDRSQIGIVGFCMGGSVALWQAASGSFAAAVTFYGGGIASPRWRGVPAGLESGAALCCPWLGLYGDKDRSATVADVQRLREVVAESGYPTDIVRYADAGHAFALDPAAPQYVPDAAADAWARTVEWLGAQLH